MIGIDYTPAYEQGGGIGRYVRELIAALAGIEPATACRLFVMGARPQSLPPLPGPHFTWCASRLSPRWFARLWHRARLPLPVELWTGGLSLFHATDFVLPPTLSRTRTLLTVHDLSFVRAPESAAPRLKAYLDRVVPRSARRADHILADSQATKDDLIALYDLPPGKIEVLYSGVSPRFRHVPDSSAVRARYHIGDAPYILAVGTVQPRKNYERLMQALTLLPDRLKDVHLIVAGGRGWLGGPIHEAVSALNLTHRVKFIGFAADEDLPALYSGARCLAFPSLYEGFGLPILEAFACETPVLTARSSSLVEVAGDAAILVDPLRTDEMAAGLTRLIEEESLRAELITRGTSQAAAFTWTKAATQLRAVYQRLAG